MSEDKARTTLKTQSSKTGTTGGFAKKLYDAELRKNVEVFQNSHEAFLKNHSKLCDWFRVESKAPYLADSRVVAMLRAVTHDLLRYASYHVVALNKITGRYDICQSVRAGVFAKWLMLMRPYNLDIMPEVSVPDDVFVDARYSNELAALYVCSYALELHNKKKELLFLHDIMPEGELNTFIYHLRYRLKHQDSYSTLFRRIKEEYAVV
jgi:hypothetical protein